MKEHLNKRTIFLLAFGLICLFGMAFKAQAQSVGGALDFGFDGGANKYWGNFSDSRFGLGGDLFIRWNIFDWLSLRGSYNAGVIQYKVTQASINDENALFPNSPGSAGMPGTLNHIRYGGWELMGEYNVFPDQSYVPYVLAGIEALNFEPDDATPSPLKGNAAGAYSKNVVGGVGGVGFDMYVTPKVTFNGLLLLHLTGTDWLDDYSDPNNSRQDAFLTFGLGFSYYIFTPPEVAPPTPEPTAIEHDHTLIFHDTTERTIVHIDTVFMARVDTFFITGNVDTLYRNPPVNTIFNFPGTLFIVNTDQFNYNVPDNLSHLYQIKDLVEQCPNLRVEIQGFASSEGAPEHNLLLSQLRADRIKTWLIAQGVDPSKIASTKGFGTSNPAVQERTDVSPEELEAERVQNRRIAVKVVQACQ